MPNKPLPKNKRILGCLILSLSVFVLGIGIVLVVIGGMTVAPRSFIFVQAGSPPADLYTLSAEQQALVDELGHPDTFTILFYDQGLAGENQQETRLEIWTYYQAGQEVTLLNGQVVERVDVERLPVSLAPVRYRPEQFAAGMDRQAVLRASGLEAYISAPLDTEGVPGGGLLFGEQVVFGFQDESLAYVESFTAESAVLP